MKRYFFAENHKTGFESLDFVILDKNKVTYYYYDNYYGLRILMWTTFIADISGSANLNNILDLFRPIFPNLISLKETPPSEAVLHISLLEEEIRLST